MIESTGVLAWRTESTPLDGDFPALLMAPPRFTDDVLGLAVAGLETVGLELERLTAMHHCLVSEGLT